MTILERDETASARTATSLDRAILETLAYSDVFDHPLRVEELHRYLRVKASLEELQAALERGVECADAREGYYFLAGRDELIAVRQRREAISLRAVPFARRYGRIVGRLPFVRMVALTGSLAMLNSEQTADIDYMLVAAKGRVWTARGFALLFGRLTARAGHTLCPNVIVSEAVLEWPYRDIYGARELCQMIPLSGIDTYRRLRAANGWTDNYLPNGSGAPPLIEHPVAAPGRLQSPLERLLRGGAGDRVESWEMDRKVARFTRQDGYGVETRFGADVCQGNFLHHRQRSREALEQRLARLGLNEPTGMNPRERS